MSESPLSPTDRRSGAGLPAGIERLLDVRWLAFAWAFTFAFEIVSHVPGTVFDALRYGGAVVVLWLVRKDEGAPAKPAIKILAALMLALAVIRSVMAVANHDNPNLKFGIVLVVATVIAYAVTQRPRIHRPMVGGYLAGLAVSALVCLVQALGWDGIAPANYEGSRYPGLSSYTTILTWQLAVALVVAGYIALRSPRWSRTFYAACALVVIYVLALVTNGAQGGFVGVAVAIAAIGVGAWRTGAHSQVSRAAVTRVGVAVVALVAIVGVAMAAGLDVPSLTDYNTNFTNEHARVDSWRNGLDTVRDHPVTGMNGLAYDRTYKTSLMPHFLPLESGATAGALGLLVGLVLVGYLVWLVLKGPIDRQPTTLAAYGVLALLTANAFFEPQGPLQGVVHAVPLFLAVLYATVERKPPFGLDHWGGSDKAATASAKPKSQPAPAPAG